MIKKLKIIPILIILSMLLTACKSKELPLDYSKNYPVSSNDKIGSRADGFSEALAVINSDVAGSLGFTVEEMSSAGLFDVNRRETLYAKNVHTQVAPASLTKIMTALIAIKYGNPEDVITCTSAVEDIDYDATKIGLKEGDKLTMTQALYALMINSANDAAVAIAEHMSGSVEAFSTLMNEEALKLGCTKTHFVNPHGLTANDHYTTAYDLYLIMNEAIKYSTFNEIIQMTEYESVYKDSMGNDKSMSFKTTNLFLRGDYQAPENVTVIGGKTGTTNAAGNCLIMVVKDTSGNPYIAVIMKASERTLVNSEMSELLREIN